jgi:hypothetical protein
MGGLRQWSQRAATGCPQVDVMEVKVMNVRLIFASLYLTISSVEYSLDSVVREIFF